MSEYLHGVETQRQKQPDTIQDASTTINATVVSVPTFLLQDEYKTINKPIPIRGYQDAAMYAGKNVEGFTGYDALNTILMESGGATIYMINVFDENKHKISKTVSNAVLTAGKYMVEDSYITNLEVRNGEILAELNKDYNFENNVIEVIADGALKDVTNLSITYDIYDPTMLTAADFVGGVNEDGLKSGLKAVEDIQALYGDEVSILTVPVYSALKAVKIAMEEIETKFQCQSYYDAPVGTSINAAIQGRQGGENVTADLTSTSDNGMICFPYLYRYNSETNKDELRPPSPVAAGLRVKLDRTRNVAKSIDNTTSITTTGTEFPIGFRINDPTSESNALNKVGITTFINYKGSYKIWGARNANYPTQNGIQTFENVQRTASYIERSIQNTSFNMVGENITQGFIDDGLNMINGFLNGLKNPLNQIIIDGEAWYDKKLNPADQLSNGRIRYCYKFCPPAPAERITYYSYIDIQIYNTLGGND